MGAFERYIENPTADGARYLGALVVNLVPNATATPPPPAEILPEHHAAFVEGWALERLRRAAPPPIGEPS